MSVVPGCGDRLDRREWDAGGEDPIAVLGLAIVSLSSSPDRMVSILLYRKEAASDMSVIGVSVVRSVAETCLQV